MHLEGHLQVAPWEAALGATVRVPTLDGEVKMKVPAGVCGGERLRLKGKGLRKGGDERGDLFMTLVLVNPSEIGERSLRLFTELAETFPGFRPARIER